MKKEKFEVGTIYRQGVYKFLCTKRTNNYITFDVYKDDIFLRTEKRKIGKFKRTEPTGSNTSSDFIYECVRVKYYDSYREKYSSCILVCDMYFECDQNLN